MRARLGSTLRSLRVRVALVVFAITAAAIAFVYVYVAPSLEHNLRQEKLQSLSVAAGASAERVRQALASGSERDLRRTLERTSARTSARATVLRASGSPSPEEAELEVVADSSSGSRPPSDLQFQVAREALRDGRSATGTESGQEGPLAQGAVPVRRGGGEHVLVLSAPLSDVERNVAFVRERVLVAAALALPFALMAGFVLAGALSQRIKRLERSARRVAAGDFEARFVMETRDELGQLALALDDMHRQLAQLDSARKRFIATASHELRTPLFSLSGFLELLQDEDLDEEDRQRFLSQVREQVQRLVKLASDLLDLSRLEAGSLELRPERTELATLAQAVTSEFEPALARHESHLELRLGAAPIEAVCDPERVGQILRILIDNALTHTPPGTDMVVSASRRNGRMRLAVKDNGGGIRRQALERIFEPFFTSDDAQGSGLGLAIARELADHMDGRLSADSRAGTTTFMLDLPPAPE